jgi:hypothetical protein
MSFTAMPGVQVVAMPSVESLRPDAVYYEISFPSTALDLQCIQFQNYYAASLVIKQKVHGKFEFVAMNLNIYSASVDWQVVFEQKLMANAHFENDAQNWHSITAAQVLMIRLQTKF